MKTRKVIPFAVVSADMERLALSDAALATALGVHQTTIGKWRNLGDAPAWTQPAIEGLVHRAKVGQDAVLVCRVPANKIDVVGQFLTALGITHKTV
jgi:hypothetical protein